VRGLELNWLIMKKEYCTPKITMFYLEAQSVLFDSSDPTIPPGPVGLAPDGFSPTSTKDVG